MYSVVIPVYQAADALERCVSSWLCQTVGDLEIILVDDGSTDGSGRMCDELAARDGRILVVHQENAGVSAARNTGIRAASGEFLIFTDSDDYVEPCCLEKMAAAQREADSDLVLCGFHHIYDGADIPKRPEVSGTWEMDAFAEPFLDLYEKSYLNMPWNKLFRREWLGEFDTGLSLGEDLLFNLAYLRKCRKVTVLPETLCFYIQEEQKTTLSSRRRKDRLELAKLVCRETERFYEERWGSRPDSRIFTRYMNEILDECEKLPSDRQMRLGEKLEYIRMCARDPWVSARGSQARLKLADYRILWFFLRRDMPRMVYVLCVLRRWAVALVHEMRRRRQR